MIPKTYVLHLAENEERYENITKNLMPFNDILNIEIWWTVKRDFMDKSYEILPTLKHRYYEGVKESRKPNVYSGVFNCALEHYTIIKQAIYRNYPYIMIMEDDFHFIIDKDELKNIFEKLPENFDIIKIFYGSFYLKNDEFEYNGECDFVKNLPDGWAISTGCYLISRNAMKMYVSQIDKFGMEPSDMSLKRLMGRLFPNGSVYTLNKKIITDSYKLKSDII